MPGMFPEVSGLKFLGSSIDVSVGSVTWGWLPPF
jgi:hypothetical protein